jgi:hypothetical protein
MISTAHTISSVKQDVTFFTCIASYPGLFPSTDSFPFFFSVDMGVFLTEVLLATYGLFIMLTADLSAVLLRYMRQKSVIAIGRY